MAFVDFDSVAEIAPCYSMGPAGIAQNVFHIAGAGAFTETTLNAAAEVYRNWFNTTGKPLVSASLDLVKILTRDLTIQFGPGTEYTDGLPITGTRAGNLLPFNCTAAVKWTTGYRGRSYRGRTFHIGLVESDEAFSELTSGVITALKAGYEDLLDAYNAVGLQMVVASRITNGAERDHGLATAITGVHVNGEIDSQRRRLPTRGS